MDELPSHPGLSAEVTVNRRPLPKYTDPEATNSPNEITNYIEVNHECDFEIAVKFGREYKPTRGVRVEILLDGVAINSFVIRNSHLQHPKNRAGHILSVVQHKIDGRWNTSGFRFSSLADNTAPVRNAQAPDSDMLMRAGTLTVRIQKVKNLFGSEVSEPDMLRDARAHTVLLEKSAQALGLSHRVDVGEPRVKPKTSTVSTTDNWQPIDDESDDKIFAIFNFKYRSRESLENLNIIPHDVEPEPKATPAPPVRVATATPVPTFMAPPTAASDAIEENGLSKEELIAVIIPYRGHGNGLEFLEKKDLLNLFVHLREAATQARGVKREPDDEIDLRLGEKEDEPIVLD